MEKGHVLGLLGSKVVVQKRLTLKAGVSWMVRQVALRIAQSSKGRASFTLCKTSIHFDKASERAGRQNTVLMKERGRREEAWCGFGTGGTGSIEEMEDEEAGAPATCCCCPGELFTFSGRFVVGKQSGLRSTTASVR